MPEKEMQSTSQAQGIFKRPTVEKVAQARAPKERIKVLHLIYSPGFGGIENMVLDWVKNFDRREFDVHLACFCGDRDREVPFLEAASAAGLTVIPVPWTRFKPFLRCAREVARVAAELNIDIIHTHAYYGDAVGAIAGKLAGVKTVPTVYVWGKYELHRQIMQVIDWTAIQFMTTVTAHCRDTANKTFVLGKSRSDIPVLLPGYPHRRPALPPEERQRRRREAGIRDDEMLLINAARLAPEKAQDQLMRSFKTIHDRFPNTRLWILGTGLESIRRQLLALSKELGLESAAELGGFRPDISDMLDIADFMVHPSHVEGIPQAVLAGMAAGLPVVASDVGGIAEVIVHGQSGMLVKENDVDGFARTMLELLENRPKALALGAAARKRIENELSTETAVRSVEDLYRNMMAQSE